MYASMSIFNVYMSYVRMLCMHVLCVHECVAVVAWQLSGIGKTKSLPSIPLPPQMDGTLPFSPGSSDRSSPLSSLVCTHTQIHTHTRTLSSSILYVYTYNYIYIYNVCFCLHDCVYLFWVRSDCIV